MRRLNADKIRQFSASAARNCSGLATVEAAIFIVPLTFAVLSIVDLGRAGADRMEIDQALRAGAQASMINIIDEAEVLALTLSALGETENGVKSEEGRCPANATCVDVSFRCECDAGVETTCASICSSTNEPPSMYLTIEAARLQQGLFYSDYEVASNIMVQTR